MSFQIITVISVSLCGMRFIYCNISRLWTGREGRRRSPRWLIPCHTRWGSWLWGILFPQMGCWMRRWSLSTHSPSSTIWKTIRWIQSHWCHREFALSVRLIVVIFYCCLLLITTTTRRRRGGGRGGGGGMRLVLVRTPGWGHVFHCLSFSR